jgi:hypothetical protein
MFIPYNGRQIEVAEVDVLSCNEPWSEYQLSEGTILLHKTVLVAVYKASNEKDPEGNALFLTKSQNIVKIKAVRK